jgi:hypothetical protein
MHEKILAQRDGLGVGWLPRTRIASLVKRGELVEMRTADPREPNTLYAGWRGDHEGRAMDWWLEKFKQKAWRPSGCAVSTPGDATTETRAQSADAATVFASNGRAPRCAQAARLSPREQQVDNDPRPDPHCTRRNRGA